GPRAARRGLRYARGRSRQRAVLRLCATHLLGIARQLAAPCLDADAHRQTGLLTTSARERRRDADHVFRRRLRAWRPWPRVVARAFHPSTSPGCRELVRQAWRSSMEYKAAGVDIDA